GLPLIWGSVVRWDVVELRSRHSEEQWTAPLCVGGVRHNISGHKEVIWRRHHNRYRSLHAGTLSFNLTLKLAPLHYCTTNCEEAYRESKQEGEDKENDGPASDWEASEGKPKKTGMTRAAVEDDEWDERKRDATESLSGS
ncbi:hypothetical protein PHLCEN_2v266, partial [Hermanssonia centrifuga]